MKTGIELIAEERKEQIEKHKRSILDDVLFNNHYQLSNAAGLLTYVDPEELNAEPINDEGTYDFSHCIPSDWNEELFNKMMNKPYKERLIIAGALIAAELDRLNHSKISPTSVSIKERIFIVDEETFLKIKERENNRVIQEMLIERYGKFYENPNEVTGYISAKHGKGYSRYELLFECYNFPVDAISERCHGFDFADFIEDVKNGSFDAYTDPIFEGSIEYFSINE